MSNFQKMNIMKKLLFLLLSVFTLQVAQADNDKPITFDKLPAKAQTFIKQNFPTEKVAFTKMEKGFLDTSYDVVFVNGNGVEFDKNGEWTELDCKRSSVPTKAVPAQITKFVKESHPNATILKLERDRYTYEVKLSNFWEIKFDKQFNVIDMDMDDYTEKTVNPDPAHSIPKRGNVPFSYLSGYRLLFSVRISPKTYLFIK